jgi:hypothetical protein
MGAKRASERESGEQEKVQQHKKLLLVQKGAFLIFD